MRATACVLWFNNVETTIRSVQSLLASVSPDTEVVLWNNGSDSRAASAVRRVLGSRASLRTLSPPDAARKAWRIVEARNDMIDWLAAERQGALWALLDNDLEYAPGWVGAYGAILDRFPEVGLVGTHWVAPRSDLKVGEHRRDDVSIVRLVKVAGCVNVMTHASWLRFGKIRQPPVALGQQAMIDVMFCKVWRDAGAWIAVPKRSWIRTRGQDPRYR